MAHNTDWLLDQQSIVQTAVSCNHGDMTVYICRKVVLNNHCVVPWAVTLTEQSTGNRWVQVDDTGYNIMTSWKLISCGVSKKLSHNTDNQTISLPLKAKFLCIDVG